MKITRDTEVYISIAERPGNFGAQIFNAAFDALSLDFIYKPFKVGKYDLINAIKGIKALGIKGCGVSMPHKINILKYLDKVDVVAKKIGAVNTVVNNGGKLYGYNTDFIGAQTVLDNRYNVKGKRVFIIGAGGAARAIAIAVRTKKPRAIFITNRNEVLGKKLAKEFKLSYVSYHLKNNFKADLFVNATPVGMLPKDNESIIEKTSLVPYEAIMDVVVHPTNTLLIKYAKEFGKIFVPGSEMALHQALAQFKLYTKLEPPLESIKNSIEKFL